MRIPLNVYDFYGGLRAVLHLFVVIETKTVLIKAMVDTGSPETIITREDIIKQRISIAGLKNKCGKIKQYNFGGGPIKLLRVDSVTLKTSNEEDQIVTIDMPVSVSIEESKEPKPSIIGVDFLLKNNLKFVFDPVNKKAYLEKLE